MKTWCRLCLLLLVGVSSCLFYNGAAAEAFTLPSAHCSTRNTLKHTDAPLTMTPRGFTGDSFIAKTRRHGVPNLMQLRAGGRERNRLNKVKLEFSELKRELFAEMLGTFLIVALGTGAVMAGLFDGAAVGVFQIAAVWTFAVTIAISTTSSVSGAHLNPAISFALALVRPSTAFGWSKLLPYCLAQLAGGILGSMVNLIMYADKIRQFESANQIVRGSTTSILSAKAFGEYFVYPTGWGVALFAEAFGTAVLAFVCFALTHVDSDTMKKSVFIPPIIGITVGALICVIAPLTQAGFNPARDFGPRLVASVAGWGMIAFKGCWVYILGPLIGAPVGAYVADKLLDQPEK